MYGTPTLTQKEFVQLKSKLTRALNSKDHVKIIKTVDEAMDIFEDKGYPDAWARWERAREDAYNALYTGGFNHARVHETLPDGWKTNAALLKANLRTIHNS